MPKQQLEPMEHHVTKNKRGFMHPISSIGQKFTLFSVENSPVLDMGTAYGNIPLAALTAGAQKVIACDMEQEHLNQLREQVNESDLSRLDTQQGYFPDGFDFAAGSIAGIHASHILEYLKPKEIEEGLKRFYDWLRPGGQLFILVYTVYIKELINEVFETEYARRKASGEIWPGYLENFNQYSSDPEVASAPFPKALHLYDIPELKRTLETLGFVLKFCEYLDGSENHAVEDALHDGREYVGIIAMKPR